MGFEIQGLDDLMKELSVLDVERVAPAMLEESVPILESSLKKQYMKHTDKGDLVESVKKTGVNRNKYGYYICVRPTGKDRKGVRNMEKAAILEYGVEGRQPATPVLTPAVKDAEAQVLQKMQEVFDREVNL